MYKYMHAYVHAQNLALRVCVQPQNIFHQSVWCMTLFPFVKVPDVHRFFSLCFAMLQP